MHISITIDGHQVHGFSVHTRSEWDLVAKQLELIVTTYFATRNIRDTAEVEITARGTAATAPQKELSNRIAAAPETNYSGFDKHFKLFDPEAIGKRVVAKLDSQQITGNMAASLETVHSLGVPITSPAQLLRGLERHPRFNTQVTRQSARNQIRTLNSAEFMDEAGELTSKGKFIVSKLAELPTLPQKSDPFSDESLPF